MHAGSVCVGAARPRAVKTRIGTGYAREHVVQQGLLILHASICYSHVFMREATRSAVHSIRCSI